MNDQWVSMFVDQAIKVHTEKNIEVSVGPCLVQNNADELIKEVTLW